MRFSYHLYFNVKAWDEIAACEKNGAYVDIAYMDTVYSVVIALPENEVTVADSFAQWFESADFSKCNLTQVYFALRSSIM